MNQYHDFSQELAHMDLVSHFDRNGTGNIHTVHRRANNASCIPGALAARVQTFHGSVLV